MKAEQGRMSNRFLHVKDEETIMRFSCVVSSYIQELASAACWLLAPCDGMSVTVKTIICFITTPIYIVNNSQVSFITEGNRNGFFIGTYPPVSY